MSHKAIQYNRFVTYGSVPIYRIFATILCKRDNVEIDNKRYEIFIAIEKSINEIKLEKFSLQEMDSVVNYS